jgi:hypothetical protein
MENPTLTEVSLSNIRVSITIMCVLVVELLCQVMMERILVLECLLPLLRGRLQLHLVLPDIKWPL